MLDVRVDKDIDIRCRHRRGY